MQKSRQSLLRPAPLVRRRKRRRRLLQRPGKPLLKRLFPSAPHLLLPGAARVPPIRRALHLPLAPYVRQQSAQAPRPRQSSRQPRHSVAQQRIVNPPRRPPRSQAPATGERHRLRSVLTHRRVVSRHGIQQLQLALPRMPDPQAEAERRILVRPAQLVRLARMEQRGRLVRDPAARHTRVARVPPRQRRGPRSGDPQPSRKSPPARSPSRRKSL